LDNLGFLAAGFAVVWIILGTYLFVLAGRQRRLERRIHDIEKGAPAGTAASTDEQSEQ
jgi:CcmD family protein